MDKKVLEEQQKNEVLTEVTSIKDQEEKTGQPINLPNEEELIQKAHSSFIMSTQLMMPIFEKLPSRGKSRVMAAILDLPKDGVPVKLRTDDERKCFGLGQRAISDRFLLTYFHTVEQIREKQKELKESETKTEETKETE